mgnify:CR=1 FL=1
MAGPDINQQMFASGQMGGNAQAPDSKAQPTDLSDFINKLLDHVAKWVKFAGVDVSNLGKVSALTHFNIEQGGIRANNPISPIKGPQGGALAQIAMSIFNYDFSKLQIPPIDAMVMNTGVDISPANLGELSPNVHFYRGQALGNDMALG